MVLSDHLVQKISSLQHISLELDETARNRATARFDITQGAVVLSDHALSTALLQTEKGRRCDYCHRVPTGNHRLFKCSGCAAFWYCGLICQKKQWKMHHKNICKYYNQFTTSSEYQTLDPREQTDAVLLSHLLAQVCPSGEHTKPRPESPDAIAIFFDLLNGSLVGLKTPPFCGDRDCRSLQVADDVYARFGNNNFVIHSHLTSYAHGIFPLGSRLFNHSCYPNCVIKYVINPQDAVTMDVVAIRDIAQGEEVTIPYLDPALPFKTRRDALQMNYGFNCICPLCMFQDHQHPIKALPLEPPQIHVLEDKLHAHVASRSSQQNSHALPSQLNATPWANLPVDLYPLFNEAYLPQLSETFSRTSHKGEYEAALSSGRTLSAYYSIVYPSNYPQIGMHALELAKTAWNYVVSRDDGAMATFPPSSISKRAEHEARKYLALARQVLECFGPEGDEGGPLEEIRIMREVLHC